MMNLNQIELINFERDDGLFLCVQCERDNLPRILEGGTTNSCNSPICIRCCTDPDQPNNPRHFKVLP